MGRRRVMAARPTTTARRGALAPRALPYIRRPIPLVPKAQASRHLRSDGIIKAIVAVILDAIATDDEGSGRKDPARLRRRMARGTTSGKHHGNRPTRPPAA